jgi:putative N6-adenine-specific DNA methylase
MDHLLAATCSFGIESVLKNEITGLGFKILRTENGRVYFRSDSMGIARANIFLRTADRIHIVLNEFPASDFDELFEGVKSVEWENIIDDLGIINVKGRSKNSKIHSVPVAQSMTKKAIIDRLLSKTGKNEIIENGTIFPVEIELENDRAAIFLNTSGEALFKRGYREGTGEAPIKETLAAALILLSGWNGETSFVDPFCGSGTLPIEAAMMLKNIAPGLNRHFLSMKWNMIEKKAWIDAANEAVDMIEPADPEIRIFGYDIDPKVLEKAAVNAVNAEVDDMISFKNVDINNFMLKGQPGVIVTNPPYGERLGNAEETELLYRAFNNSVRTKKGWEINVITAHPEFQEIFGRAIYKRKLYNGNIKCNYYHFKNKI